MNIRMTPLERKILDNRVKLSGLCKQDYMIQSSLNHQVICYGNVKVFEEMQRQLDEINTYLLNISCVEDLEVEKLEVLRMIIEMINGLQK